MNDDDDSYINAKAWNFRARDGTNDWAEMVNNAQKRQRVRDDEVEEEQPTVEFGIDRKEWDRWVNARDGVGANLNFNQHRHQKKNRFFDDGQSRSSGHFDTDYFTGDIEKSEDYKKWLHSRDGSGANNRA